MKMIAKAGLAAAAMILATPALAEADFYVGAQAGYHSLGDNPFGDNDGAIYGGYLGIDAPVGERLILGIEGNYNFGSGAIDSEYGIAGKLGVRVGDGGQLFLRAGYQEVDLDLDALISDLTQADLDAAFGVGVVTLSQVNSVNLNALGIDDDTGDYLLGAGGQARLSRNLSFRAVVDTIAFDTFRVTAGFALHF